MFNAPIAHRGLWDMESPENSIGAFLNAIDYGYSIELDVSFTKDLVPVIFHDKSLLRLTGVDKNIADCYFCCIKKLTLINSNQKIPTLAQVLDIVSDSVPLYIEIKNYNFFGYKDKVDKLMELLKDYDGRYVIKSFDYRIIKYIYKKYNSTSIIQIVSLDNFRRKLIFYPIWFLARKKVSQFSVSYEYFKKKKIFSLFANSDFLLWTIKDIDEYNKCKKITKNVVFENFKPEKDK